MKFGNGKFTFEIGEQEFRYLVDKKEDESTLIVAPTTISRTLYRM